MLAFSSHNIFNFLPFTLIQLTKFVMQMQCKPLQQRPSWAKLPVRTKLHSSFSIAKLCRKTSKPTLTLPAELWQICFCHLKRSLPFHQEHLPQLSYWGQPALPGTGVTVRWRWVVLECLTPILPVLCPHAGCFPENRHKGYLLSFEERGTSLATIFLCGGQFFWEAKTSNYCKLSQAVLLTCIVFKQGNNSHHPSSTGKIIWKFASD